MSGLLGAEETPQDLTASARPFVRSSVDLVLDYGAAPARLRLVDLAWLAPSAVALGALIHNDVPIYRNLAQGSVRQPWLDHSMPAVSALGDGLVEFSAAALMQKLGPPRLQKVSRVAMQGLIVAAVYSSVLKFAAWSNRPGQDDTQHRFWDFSQPTTGMPSGHSFSAFCMAEVYGDEYGRIWTYPLAAVVGYSRIYNSAHWPSDVFAGAVLGVLAGWEARRVDALRGPSNLQFSLLPIHDAPGVAVHARF